ncbi:hypothetical protein Taro_036028, partial [Colocasia esculenta]|nr:hypothetical protein [Colocasia esculenta]
GQTREQPFPLLFLLFFSFSIFVRFHSFRWLTGARGKTLVRETGLDRAENSGSGGDFREEASKGSARIEVWQDFFHASEVRRGPAAVEAPVVQENQPQVQEDQPPVQEGQPPVNEDQPPVNEDQPHVADEVDVPLNAPLSPQLQPYSSLNPDIEIPSFSPQPQVQASTSFGGPSVPPELYTFLNDKFDALNTSIQTMTENLEVKVQRLENTMSVKFIEQKAASDHVVQRFNRLIGTLADASVELKEHQEQLETVLKGILANSQADVFNTKETLSQITKTRLSFAHLVDDLERTNIYCKGGVDTPHTGVDTMLQVLRQKIKKWSTSVDTRPGQVDTRDRSQRNKSTDFYSRSTPDGIRSTLESLPRRPVLQLATAGRHYSISGRH